MLSQRVLTHENPMVVDELWYNREQAYTMRSTNDEPYEESYVNSFVFGYNAIAFFTERGDYVYIVFPDEENEQMGDIIRLAPHNFWREAKYFSQKYGLPLLFSSISYERACGSKRPRLDMDRVVIKGGCLKEEL